jgi:hypothetical protein
MKNPSDSTGQSLADLVALVASCQAEILRLNERIELLREKPRTHNEYWLSPGETAQRLGITTRTLINRRLRGEIPRNCWSKENIRFYTYRESWVEAARRADPKTLKNLFESAA